VAADTGLAAGVAAIDAALAAGVTAVDAALVTGADPAAVVVAVEKHHRKSTRSCKIR
jgi:phenylpyruvate tautomerase PptA (4-oxalocrotonate tautomerase family)